MKIKLNKLDSKVIKSNEVYDVIDNTNLKNLVVSKTVLHPGKETGGHSHKDQEEVYMFSKGSGKMKVGEKTYNVRQGSIILIPKGDFHKVWNIKKDKLKKEDLEFICVFEGKRNN